MYEITVLYSCSALYRSFAVIGFTRLYTSYQQMSPCLMTSPLLGQQWSIRWLKRVFSLQQASPVDPVWVNGFRFGNWPQHWRSFFVTKIKFRSKIFTANSLCYSLCASWESGQGELTQSTLGRENVQVHLCVYLNVNFRRAFWHEITKREFFKLKLVNFREKFFCHVSRAQTGVILFHVSEHLRGNIVSILDLDG